MAEKAFGIGIDTSELEKDGKKIEKTFSNIEKVSKIASASIDNGWRKAFDGAEIGTKSLKKSIKEQESFIDDLERKLKNLRNEKGNTAPGMVQNNLQLEINSVIKEINGEKQALSEMKAELDNISPSVVSLTSQIQKNNQALAEMVRNKQQLSPEYQNLIDENVKLAQSLKVVKKEVNSLTTNASGLQGLTQLSSGVAGGFSALQGAMALFGRENEDLQKTMLKVQSAMAITVGLQQASTLLDKQSAFQVAILTPLRRAYNAELAKSGVATTTAAAGTTALSGAETAATATTFSLTAAIKALGVSIKNIPVIGWILASAAALVSIIGLIVRINSKQKEMTQEQKNRLELMKKEREAYISAAENVEQVRAKLNMNITAIQTLTKGSAAWNGAIKSVAEELGVSESWLKKNIDKVESLRDAYIDMAQKTAFANALAQKSAEMIVEASQAQNAIASGGGKRAETIDNLIGFSTEEKETFKDAASEIIRIKKEIADADKEIEKGNSLTWGGKVAQGSKKRLENLKNDKKELEKELSEQQKIYNTFYKKVATDAEEQSKKLQEKSAESYVSSMQSMEEIFNAQNESEKQEKAQEKWEDIQKRKIEFLLEINKEIEDIEADTEEKILQLRIDRIHEETKKKVDELKLQGEEEVRAWIHAQKVIGKLREDYNKEKQAQILTLEEETARLLLEIEKKGLDVEKASHLQRIDMIEKERLKRLEAAKDNQELQTAINNNSDAQRAKEEFDFYDKMTQKYADYAQKRKEIEKRFNDEIALMQQVNMRNTAAGQPLMYSQEQIELAKKMQIKALAELDKETMKTNHLLVRMFANTRDMSSKELEKLKKEVEEFIQFLEEGNYATLNKWGISEEQFKQLSESGELEKLKERFKQLTEESYKFNNEIDNLVVSWEQFLEAVKNGDSKDIENAFNELIGKFVKFEKIAFDVGKNIIESLKGISPELDRQIEGIEQAFDTISTIGQRAGQGAAAGGIWGAIAGGAIGVIESVVKNMANRKKKDAEDEKNFIQQRLEAEIEIYEWYKKRLDITRRIQETELDYLNREKQSLIEKEKLAEKERFNSFNKLMGIRHTRTEKAPTGKGVYQVVGNLWDYFAEDIQNGKWPGIEEFEDYINRLKQAGNDTKELEQALDDLKNKTKDVADFQNQLAESFERQREVYAGITYSGLADSILNAFKKGEVYAQDFADSFKDIMNNAFWSIMFNDLIMEEVRPFLERLADFAKGIFTGEEGWGDWSILDLEKEWIELNEELWEKVKPIQEMMERVLGISDTRSAQAQGFSQASQDSITELNGRFSAVQLHTFQISESVKLMYINMQNQLGYLKRISENTDNLGDMKKAIIDMQNDISYLKQFGIKTV